MRSLWLAASVLMLLAGCEQMPVRPEPPVPCPPASTAAVRSEVEDWLLFQEKTRKMSAAEVSRELESARLAYQKERSESNRMRLAFLYLAATGKGRDLDKAIGLLESAQKEARSDDPARRAFAGLLLGLAVEIKRDEDLIEQDGQKLRDEQKRGDDLQQKLIDLQAKLEALKAMELRVRRIKARPLDANK